MNEMPVFPTMFYEAHLDRGIAFQVLDEIKSKRQIIDIVSEATQPHPVSDYSTDYSHSIRIESFWDFVVPFLDEQLAELNQKIEIFNSWVACYSGPAGHHPLHNHHLGYDGRNMYSGILYLSDIGNTDFFSTSITCKRNTFTSPSEIGKIVLFPSIIPHQYRSERYDGNTRYVLPFNGQLLDV